MMFITVPRTGKLLLEFVSNSDSQNLGRIWKYWGTVQKRPTKTSPCCRKAFPCKASGVWWDCEIAQGLMLGIAVWQFSLLSCVGKRVRVQWLEEEEVNFSLRRYSLLAVWVTVLGQLICEAGTLVIDIFKSTWNICIETAFNPASWGADQGTVLAGCTAMTLL